MGDRPVEPAAARGRAGWVRRLCRRPAALAGLGLVALFLLAALAAPWLAPFDPVTQPARRLLPPGTRYLLGTDEFGRDVLSRIVFGARVSLQVGVVSVGLALALGGVRRSSICQAGSYGVIQSAVSANATTRITIATPR